MSADRPPKIKKDVALSVRVDATIDACIARDAAAKDRPKSQVVREIVRQHYAAQLLEQQSMAAEMHDPTYLPTPSGAPVKYPRKPLRSMPPPAAEDEAK